MAHRLSITHGSFRTIVVVLALLSPSTRAERREFREEIKQPRLELTNENRRAAPLRDVAVASEAHISTGSAPRVPEPHEASAKGQHGVLHVAMTRTDFAFDRMAAFRCTADAECSLPKTGRQVPASPLLDLNTLYSAETVECRLDRLHQLLYLNEASRTWLLDDVALEEVENDLQMIINCTTEGDVILFDVSRRVRPTRRLTIPWSLTLSAAVDETALRGGIFPQSKRKTRFRCPHRNDGIFDVRFDAARLEGRSHWACRGQNVLFANLLFEQCAFEASSQAIIQVDACNGTEASILRMHHATFRRNLLVKFNGVKMKRSTCGSVELIDVRFHNNTCIGHGCGVLLAHTNTVTDVRAERNQLKDSIPCPGSLFNAPTDSHTRVERLNATGNRMTVIRVMRGTLELSNSTFTENEVSLGDDEDPLSTSIHLVGANATVSDSIFRGNSARLGAVLYGTAANLTFLGSVLEGNTAVNGAGMHLGRGSTVFISDCNFSHNTATEDGGVLYVTDSRLHMVNVQAQHNVADEKGGTCKAINSNVTIDASHFSDGSASLGGLLALLSSDSDVKRSDFARGYGTCGGCIYAEKGSTLNVRRTEMHDSRAERYGGILCLESASHAVLSNSNFTSNSASVGGNVMFVERSTLEMRQNEVSSNQGARRGGVILGRNGSRVEVTESRFERNSADYGGVAALYGDSHGLLQNCSFFNHKVIMNGGCLHLEHSHLSVQGCHFERGSAKEAGFLFQFFTETEISESTFLKGQSSKGGAIKCSGMSRVQVFSSKFIQNKADKGGALEVGNKTTVIMKECDLHRNEAQRNGGSCYFDGSNATFSHCHFYRNAAEKGGSIAAGRHAHIRIEGSTCERGKGELGGCLYGYGKTVFDLEGTTLSDSRAEKNGGAMGLVSGASAVLSNSSFVRNRAEETSSSSGGAIWLKGASLVGEGLHFSENSAGDSGGSIRGYQSSTLEISDSKFFNNRASVGGAVSFEDSVKGVIVESFFQNSSAMSRGGASHVLHSSLTFINCTLGRNTAEAGGGITAQNATVTIEATYFVGGNAAELGGFIEASEKSEVAISDVLMMGGRSSQGGAVYLHESHLKGHFLDISDCRADLNGGAIAGDVNSTILCADCSFARNHADRGGAVSMTSYGTHLVAIQFEHSMFHKNRAQYGGGLHLLSPEMRNACGSFDANCSYVVLDDTVFLQNEAGVAGGGLLSTDLSNVRVSCDAKEHSSGLEFYSLDKLKSLQTLSTGNNACQEWRENSASSYAQNAGSYASRVLKRIILRESNKTVEIFGDHYVVKDHPSGKPLPEIQLQVTDHFGQGPAVGVTNQSITASMNASDGFFSGAIIEELEGGRGNFSRVVGFGAEGDYQCTISFSEAGLSPFVIEVHVRGCRIGEAQAADGILCEPCSADTFNFSPDKGESCKSCPDHGSCATHVIQPLKGYWHWSPCSEHVQRCLASGACDFEGREAALSAAAEDVANCSAFTEATTTNYVEAQCKEGHTGPLCGSCKSSYGKSRSSQCLKCFSGFVSVVLVSLSAVVLLFLSGVTVRCNLVSLDLGKKIRPFVNSGLLTCSSTNFSGSTINGTSRRPVLVTSSQMTTASQTPEIRRDISRPPPGLATPSREPIESPTADVRRTTSASASSQSSVEREAEYEKWRAIELFKITINYLQVSAIAVAINADWNSMLIIVFEVAEYLGGVTSEAATRSVDCLVPEDFPVERSIVSSIVDSLIPLAVFILFCIFWVVVKIATGKCLKELLKNIILSGCAVLYLSYTSLTKAFVKVLSCVTVHDSFDPTEDHVTLFWAVDTRIQCYKGSHAVLAATMGWPVLALYSLGFPVLIACLTIRHVKEDPKSGWIYEVAGFMYRAYTKKYVFWESVILLRKAVLVSVVVLSYPLGPNLQAVLAVLVLAFALFFHLTCRPYRDQFKGLDDMESLSVLVSLLTFLSSIFFGDDRVSSEVRLLITACVTACNALLFFSLIAFAILFATKYLRTFLDLEQVPYNAKGGMCHILFVYVFVYQVECCKEYVRDFWQYAFGPKATKSETETQSPQSSPEADV